MQIHNTLFPLILPWLAAHNGSHGTSRFELGDHDDIAVTIVVDGHDVSELCPALDDAGLSQCAQVGMPRWLRVRVHDVACVLTVGPVARKGSGVAFSAIACDDEQALKRSRDCKLDPARDGCDVVVVEWGLFAGSRLEHDSDAVLIFPDERREHTVLSRRQNRWVVPLKPPASQRPLLVAAMSLMATIIALIYVGWRWKRPRPLSARAPAPPAPFFPPKSNDAG